MTNHPKFTASHDSAARSEQRCITKWEKVSRSKDSASGKPSPHTATGSRKSEEPFAKDWLGNNVFLAEHAEVDRNAGRVNKLLLLIGKYMGWNDDISHVFVSDMSTLGDFCLEKKQLAGLSKKLGFKVDDGDYLFEIAERIEP